MRASSRRVQGGALGAVVALAGLSPGVVEASAGVNLSLMHCWGEHRAAMVEKMVADFTAQHPGVKVDIQLVGCGTTLGEKLTTALAAGKPPDVAMLYTFDMVALADSGALTPLDSWMRRDQLAPSLWYPTEIKAGEWRGSTYGLPIRTGGDSNSLIFYNRDIFAEVGLPDRAPATWQELESYSRKLIRYDGDKLVRNPVNVLNTGDYGNVAWLYGGGAQFLSEDLRRVTFHAPAGVEALDWLYRFRTGVFRKLGDDQVDARQTTINGQTAMLIGGVWEFDYIWRAKPDFNLGAGVRPRREGSPWAAVHPGTYVYVVPASSPNRELAWELVKWLTVRRESSAWFLFEQKRPSPIASYNREFFRLNPLFSVIGEAITASALLTATPVHRDLLQLYGSAFNAVVRGQQPARAALEEAARQAQAVLDKYWQSR